jgi:hypothetical protein
LVTHSIINFYESFVCLFRIWIQAEFLLRIFCVFKKSGKVCLNFNWCNNNWRNDSAWALNLTLISVGMPQIYPPHWFFNNLQKLKFSICHIKKAKCKNFIGNWKRLISNKINDSNRRKRRKRQLKIFQYTFSTINIIFSPDMANR